MGRKLSDNESLDFYLEKANSNIFGVEAADPESRAGLAEVPEMNKRKEEE